jgi:2'-5' RNA ligase
LAKLRLGVAAMLSGEACSEVQGIRKALGERGVERMDPHITLVPPFNLSVDEVDGFVVQVGRIFGNQPPFSVHLGGASTFSDESPVLFLEVTDLDDTLQSLTEQLLPHTPFEYLRRVYHPHCTLGDGLPSEEIASLIRSLSAYDRTIDVSTIAIMEKPDAPPKSRWRPFASFELGEYRHVIRGGLELDLSILSDSASVYSPGYGPTTLAFVGAKLLGRCDCLRVAPRIVELQQLVVDDPALRSRGVGRALWETTLGYLRAQNVSIVLAKPEPSHEEFLAGLGFVEVDDPLLGLACYGVISKLWSFSIR